MIDKGSPIFNVLGINRRNLELISTYNPRYAYPLVDDKLKTKEVLEKAGVPFPETLYVIGNFFEIDSSIRLMEEVSRVEKFFAINAEAAILDINARKKSVVGEGFKLHGDLDCF